MKKRGRHLRKLLVSGAMAVLGVLGFSSCKTAQKTKSAQPEEKPEVLLRDSVRPPYGEAVLMYGTPYRRYEQKRQVPEAPIIREDLKE